MSFGISACGHQNKDPLLILASSINLQLRRQVLSTSHSSPFQRPRVGHPSQVKGSLLCGPPPTKEGHATWGSCYLNVLSSIYWKIPDIFCISCLVRLCYQMLVFSACGIFEIYPGRGWKTGFQDEETLLKHKIFV